MNVLMISNDRKLFEDGSDVRSRHVKYGELVDDLCIIVYAKKGLGLKTESIAKNVTIVPTNSESRWLYISDAIRLGKLFQSVDLVTSQDPAECGLSGLSIARYLKVPLQVQMHTDLFNPMFVKHSIPNFMRTIISRYILRRASCVRVVSKRAYQSLATQRIPNFESKTIILPVFVDVQKFKKAEPKFDLRQKYKQFDKILLVVSRLEPEKNVGLAIRVMKQILNKFPRAGLVILGDGSIRGQLEKRGADLGASIIFEGRVDDSISYYKGSDLMLVTSDYEGYGMAIVEALASGLCVLSLDVGIAVEAGAMVEKREHFVDKAIEILSRESQESRVSLLRDQQYGNYKDFSNALVKSWSSCI